MQIIVLFFMFMSTAVYAVNPNNLLPVEKAFKLSSEVTKQGTVQLTWDIAEGYYLYRNKISVQSKNPTIKIGPLDLPTGKVKHDAYFGEVFIYRGPLSLPLSVKRSAHAQQLTMMVKWQGCADVGVCYPPQKTQLQLELPAVKKAFNPLKAGNNNFNFGLNLFEDKLLPAEHAFPFFAALNTAGTKIRLNWQIAEGYYLYREKINLQIIGEGILPTVDYAIPRGTPKTDAAFGEVELLYGALNFDALLQRSDGKQKTLQLKVTYQGCAERGVCYPPMQKIIPLSLPEIALKKETVIESLSEQDSIIAALQHDSFLLTLFSFLGFGLLLAFTPCIFPMIPILSGIIVGQGEISARKAFLLSLSYVFASALMYMVFGLLAALFGSNLQADFQAPWVIYLFSLLFIALSFSMFGFYQLQVPKSMQSLLHHNSDKHRDGSYLGAGLMGAFSSLIVGPCVAAPLAAALIYIGQTGDIILGASALFMMGFGMGAPLLIIGTSAGKFLPKAGSWLNMSKSVFGVIMLAVAVWMLSRVIAPELTMLLWAMLCVIPAIYLRALDPLPMIDNGWHKLWKGLGVILCVYGVLILIGLSAGSRNPLQPLKFIALNKSLTKGGVNKNTVAFKIIHSSAELHAELQAAKKQGKWVMLDFYADWCISCKEMEAYTFSNEQVKQQLSDVMLLKVDVTANNKADKALLNEFSLFGPPALLFFYDQQEHKDKRVIGYKNAEDFLQHLQNL